MPLGEMPLLVDQLQNVRQVELQYIYSVWPRAMESIDPLYSQYREPGIKPREVCIVWGGEEIYYWEAEMVQEFMK